MAPKIRLCNVWIDNITLDGAVKTALAEEKSPHAVFTPNAVMLDACRRDPRLADLLNRATLSIPDGAGVLWAARRNGTPLRERIAGIEFGEAVIKKAAEEGLGIFLLGGRDGVSQRAAERLSSQYPNLKILGAHHGYFPKSGAENDEVLSLIIKRKPDVLFVCLGFPAQEKWIVENLPSLPFLRLAAGLGGSLDVWAGEIKRAPKPLQKLGLEWAWRMAKEPKRLKNLPSLLRFRLFS